MAPAATTDSLAEFSELLVQYYGETGPRTVKLTKGVSAASEIARIKTDPRVRFVEPNVSYEASIIPSDTHYNNAWYLRRIKAPEAWDKLNQSPRVTIAVIDSGVAISHPDLADNIWINRDEIAGNDIDDDGNGFIDDLHGWDFIAKTADPNPKFEPNATLEGINHGTIVAGIMAASGNNAAGISGVTWRAQIMPLRVLNGQGQGKANDVVKAIDYAIANNADIINLSFNGFRYSQGTNEAIKRAYDAGVIIVAAAGNEIADGKGHDLSDVPVYPVCYDGPRDENWVIGVAATDPLDQKMDYSSYGFRCIDIAAPGVSIFSTTVYAPDKQIGGQVLNKYYDGYWSGTSMAAPIVSGALALIEAADPEISRSAAIDQLLSSADNISRLNPNYLGQLGRGRLNLEAAVMGTLNRFKNKSIKLAYRPMAATTNEALEAGNLVRLSDQEGNNATSVNLGDGLPGGYSLAGGDVNGDGFDELIAGAGRGNEPRVKVFNQQGRLLYQFLAFAKSFKGGVNVAAGDVDGDGRDEVIAAAGPGGGPQVRIFIRSGTPLGQFFAYGKTFKGGVNVAAGDVDGDGRDEVITAAGPGGGPHVKVFRYNGDLRLQFFAYGKNFTGGVRVAAADLDGLVANRTVEIITVPAGGMPTQVKIFDRTGKTRGHFYAFDKKFTGGASISAGDLNRDGIVELVTGAGPGGGPHIRAFDQTGRLTSSFYGLDEKFRGGINVTLVESKPK